MTAAIILTFMRQFSGGLLQLGIVFMIARVLGEEGLGDYAIIALMPVLISQTLSLGLTVSITYFVSARIFSLQEAYRITRDVLLALAALGMLCTWLVLELFSEVIFPNIEPRLLFLVILALPFTLINMGMMAFFQALEDFKSFNKLSIAPPFITFGIVGSALFFGYLNLAVASAALVAGHVAGSFVGICLVSSHTSILGKSPERYAYLKQALPYGFKAYVANLTAFLTYRIDLLLVNFFLGAASTGLYVAAIRMVEQLWLISQAVSTVILPRLASMVDDEEESRHLAPLIARYVLWVTGVSAILVALFADFLLEVLFGVPFKAAASVLHILLPGIVVFSVARIISNALAARGKVSINLCISFGVLVGNAILNYIFIPRYGMEGAATATFATYTIATIAFLLVGSRVMKVNIFSFLSPQSGDVKLIQNFFGRRKGQ